MIIFLYGEDAYRSREKLNYYKAGYVGKYGDINLSVFDEIQDLEKLKADITSLPFLAEKRMVILRNAFQRKDFQEKIVKALEKIPEETILIIHEEGIPDKRSSLFKRLLKEKYAEEFQPLSEGELKKWLAKKVKEKGGQIDPRATALIYEFLGNDLWQIAKELEKLLDFNKEITEESIRNLIKPKTTGNIFGLLDAIAQKNPQKALGKLDSLLESGENELFILSMITKEIRNILLVKDFLREGMGEQEIASKMKAHPYVVKKAMISARKISFEELKNIYEKLMNYDKATKTGALEPTVALDLLVNELSS